MVAAQQGQQQGWFESIERALNLSPAPAEPKPLWAQLFKRPGQQTMIRNAYEQGFQQGLRQATKTAPKPVATGAGALLEDSNLTKQVIALGASGAVLGPLLDGLHSSHNVLHYNNPSHLTIDAIGFDLETCWWVPVLFGIAGATIGTALPLLDRWRAEAATGNPNVPLKYPPSWPAVLVAISLFTFQYYLSAELELPIMGLSLFNEIPVLDLLLAFYAVVFWAVFDATGTGLLVAGSTAIAGPIVELFLINVAGAYEYMHPPIDGAGIPSWIPWVYFCGAVAVGALGRRVNAQLQE